VYILSEVGGSLTLFKNITSLLFDMDTGMVGLWFDNFCTK
jgi:hypothetical protein